MDSAVRWLVETKPDVFDDVGAEHVGVRDGALVFTSPGKGVQLIYAPGQWLTVVPQED